MKFYLFEEFIDSIKRLIRKMKITCFLLFVFASSVFANTATSQVAKVSITMKNTTVAAVINVIEKQTDYLFVYSKNEIDLARKVSVDAQQQSVAEVLTEIFDKTNFIYAMEGSNIMLMQRSNTQQRGKQINGKVTDASGGTMPGVSVIVKGTTIGVITDITGNFSLSNVPANAKVVFSFVGMKTQEIDVTNKTTYNIVMIAEATVIDEVVVIGYGTQRKSDLTGAITQVKSQELASVSVSNPIQALQGRAAGVAVLTNNQPGSSPTLRIRGSGSINAGNDPLYVVDGFPLMDNNLNDINSNDIESMEVLKDASSSAIYGSRGANGVVIITTKKGQKGKNNLSFSSYVGVQTPERLVKMLNRDEFIKYVNDAYTYSTGKPVYTSTSPAPSYNTDWGKAIVNNKSIIQEHSITFDGSKDQTSYMLSASMFSQEGLVAASGFKKYTLHNNMTHEFKKWLTVGTHMQISNSTQDIRDNATGDVFRFGWPTTPIKNPDGSWYYSFLDPQHDSYIEGSFNPIADGLEVTNQSIRNRLLGDVYAEITFTKNLKFKTNFGMDLSNTKGYQYSTSRSSAGLNTGGKGVGGQSYNKMMTNLTESILTYSNVWAGVHRFSATGVYSYQDFSYDAMNIKGSGFQNDATGANDMTLATRESVTYGSNKYGNKLSSWTARMSYNYDEKYMVTATGRYDGSSRFGQNNKWGFFPSLGFGWRINQESFLKNNKVISNLKLRTSYGVTGNQEISNYSSLPKLTSANYNYNNALMQGFTETIGNSDLKWERTTQYDFGVDLGLWNRIDFNLDYYDRTTNNLLYQVPIPTTSGYSSILNNVGEVKNNGFEFTLHARVIDRVFKWDLTTNISKNINKISKLYGNVEKILLGTSANGFAQFLAVGKPVNSVWTRESAGIIRTQEQLTAYRAIRSTAQLGEEMYVDQNANKSIGTDDYICIGSPEPKFFYGLSSNFEYKKFKLDIYGQGAYDYASIAGIDNNAFGSKSTSIGYASNTGSYLIYGENQLMNSNYQPSQYAYDRMWSESNPNGIFPRAGAKDVYVSNRTNGGWNYFIVKNIKLGYDFSSAIKNINWIKELTVYVNAQNYISFANQRGYNPENGDVSYPWSKTMIFGINAKF